MGWTVTQDNGDGTGQRLTFAADGTLLGTEALTGLPIPSDPNPPEVVVAETIAAEIDARLAPADVNSIAEMKAAIRDGLAAAVEQIRGAVQ